MENAIIVIAVVLIFVGGFGLGVLRGRALERRDGRTTEANYEAILGVLRGKQHQRHVEATMRNESDAQRSDRIAAMGAEEEFRKVEATMRSAMEQHQRDMDQVTGVSEEEIDGEFKPNDR